MLRVILILAAALLTASPTPAKAGGHYYNGNELYSICSGDTYVQKGACTGYIMGVSDGMQIIADISDARGTCVPDSVRSGQLRDVIMKHLRDNPEYRHKTASLLVLAAIMTSFPCAED